MLLALNSFGEPALGGWYVGLAIGFLIVLVVVIVVGTILALATRVLVQARTAVTSLEEARATTQPLHELGRTNESLRSILQGAQAARRALGG
ncbi:MAG: hypothetical protein ACRDQ5_05045 [Sciscionella sp.]